MRAPPDIEPEPRLCRGDDYLVHYVEASAWLIVYCTGESLAQLERYGILLQEERWPTCMACVTHRWCVTLC
jgi:hypothetical protein